MVSMFFKTTFAHVFGEDELVRTSWMNIAKHYLGGSNIMDIMDMVVWLNNVL